MRLTMAMLQTPDFMEALAHNDLRDRLKMVVAAGVIQALDMDTRESWPNGRDRPQDQAVSE